LTRNKTLTLKIDTRQQQKILAGKVQTGGAENLGYHFSKMSAAFSRAAAIFQDGRFFPLPPQDAPLSTL